MSRNKPPKKQQSRYDRSTRQMVNLAKNPVWKAFAGKPVTAPTQTSVGLAARKALYYLQSGNGSLSDIGEINVTAYTGQVLSERGYGPDMIPDFVLAIDVLARCDERAQSTGKWELDTQEAKTIDIALNLHEQQIQLAGKSELANALIEAYTRFPKSTSSRYPERAATGQSFRLQA